MTTPAKRTWCYVQPPAAFEVAPCDCGNCETQWSEFEGQIWCAPCSKDFAPAHNGILDGPIPAQAAAMFGISFDRVNLETKVIERFDPETGAYAVAKPKGMKP